MSSPQLITAVYNADAGDECDWAEWKSSLDLSSRHGAFHIGRAILGFANRDPAICTHPFGGTAYVIVGAEPGNIEGIEPTDGAQLQSKVARYVGSPSPFWRHSTSSRLRPMARRCLSLRSRRRSRVILAIRWRPAMSRIKPTKAIARTEPAGRVARCSSAAAPRPSGRTMPK